MKSSEFTVKSSSKIASVISKYKKRAPKQIKKGLKTKRNSFNTSRNKVMAKIRKFRETQRSREKQNSSKRTKISKSRHFTRSMIGISNQPKLKTTQKGKSRLKSRKNSCQEKEINSKVLLAFQNSQKQKIKHSNSKTSSKASSLVKRSI